LYTKCRALLEGLGLDGCSAKAWTPRITALNALSCGEFTASGLRDRVAEAVSRIAVAEVGQGGNAEESGKPVQGVDQAVGAGAGGVVLVARPDRGDPQRSVVRGRDDLHVPAVMLCFPDHQRSAPFGLAAATRSVRITVPSRFRWVYPAAAARSGAVDRLGAWLARAVSPSCRQR
jgi:hypothetical protein